MDKTTKNIPYTNKMQYLNDRIVTLSMLPNRAERRKRKRARTWFTKTPMLLKKLKRIKNNTKQKNSLVNKFNKIIREYITF